MRTTINLDDDVFDVVRDYAESRSISLGGAVSQLVRKGLDTPTPTRRVKGFVVFDVPADNSLTTEQVKDFESGPE
ncbi:MAG TPA: hypothetical protein VGF08_06910 [Terriglobales bacterium]|jgi:hypothetical protein